MPRLVLLVFLIACRGTGTTEIGEACRTHQQCVSGVCGPKNRCTTGEPGAKCDIDRECLEGRGLHCFLGTCRELGREGEACRDASHCKVPLGCGGRTCVHRDRVAAADAAAAARDEAERRKQAAEKEARLLQESGVDGGPKAERAVEPPGPGSRVRVATGTAIGTSFAACRSDERLIGGGCKGDVDLRASYPSAHGDQDTVGARWNCETARSKEIIAYALCGSVRP
jgi:hypothetical protein